MRSTMQDAQLGIPLLLRHMRSVTTRSCLYTQSHMEGRSFGEIADRAGRIAEMYGRHGLMRGDVVASLCCSSEAHLLNYLGVPGAGMVLHTVNIRLHDEQVAFILNDGGARAVVCDAEQLGRLADLLPRCPSIQHVFVVGAGADQGQSPPSRIAVKSFADELEASRPRQDWADIDEHEGAIICHTGGTTGTPKGVIYSHRSLWLQAMSLCTANSLGMGADTRILPAVPLYHVNGWGLPFAAFMSGAEIVLPDQSLHPDDLVMLIDEFDPQLVAGVPTIWHDVLMHLLANGRNSLGSVRTIACGGAQVPAELVRAYADLGVEVIQAWGMTETSSMSAIGRIPPWAHGSSAVSHYGAKQGRISAGLEVRICDVETGEQRTSDGTTLGEIQIRGPWVTASYLGGGGRDQFHDGWLRTGDIGTVDPDGYVWLADRAKDAIKSGGEWIPSSELERFIRMHPSVENVAVVGIPDPRWQERPAGVVVLKAGHRVLGDELSVWLRSHVARWWVPDRWMFIPDLPRTSVGKIDKKLIRQMIRDGSLGIDTGTEARSDAPPKPDAS